MPEQVTPFAKLKSELAKTKVWSERWLLRCVFFNVEDREPRGIIAATEYESFRNEMKKRFEALTDDKGRPLNSLVFNPRRFTSTSAIVAPDLIVHFGGLYWRSIGSVGHGRLHLEENDTGPDACNHAQFGMFILCRECELKGEFRVRACLTWPRR